MATEEANEKVGLSAETVEWSRSRIRELLGKMLAYGDAWHTAIVTKDEVACEAVLVLLSRVLRWASVELREDVQLERIVEALRADDMFRVESDRVIELLTTIRTTTGGGGVSDQTPDEATIQKFARFVAREVDGFLYDVPRHPDQFPELVGIDAETLRCVSKSLGFYIDCGFDNLAESGFDEGWVVPTSEG